MKHETIRAIISGGVSGLGLATARALVAAGAQVTLVDINGESADGVLDELGPAARFVQADVSDENEVLRAVESAHKQMDGLNLVVNAAGILGAARVLGRQGPMPSDLFRKTLEVNLLGSFNLAKCAAALMQHNEPMEDGERGLIINTASVAAFEGQIGQAAYAASKGGIVGMTLPMARELGRFGIRVMTIAPGIFETPMVAGMPEEVQASLAASIPFPGRLGQGSEYAALVLHIAENRYLNGETIRLDGATRLQPR